MNETSDKLETRVRNAVISDKSFNPNWDINILNENGVITLLGSVPSKEAMKKVENIVRNHKGVVSVINQLDIKPNHEPNPSEIDVDNKVEVPPSKNHPIINQ